MLEFRPTASWKDWSDNFQVFRDDDKVADLLWSGGIGLWKGTEVKAGGRTYELNRHKGMPSRFFFTNS